MPNTILIVAVVVLFILLPVSFFIGVTYRKKIAEAEMGSAEEKAEYKKTMLPYVIGAILVFAASNIAGLVFNFATNASGKNP